MAQLTFYRGNMVTNDYITALVTAFKDGCSLEGLSITDPDSEILHALEWAGLATEREAWELGRSFARFHGP